MFLFGKIMCQKRHVGVNQVRNILEFPPTLHCDTTVAFIDASTYVRLVFIGVQFDSIKPMIKTLQYYTSALKLFIINDIHKTDLYMIHLIVYEARKCCI